MHLAEGHGQQAELRRMFLALREECIWLRCCYNTFSALYESGAETKEVLQASAESFFEDLSRIMQEYILLQVCKITDPEQTMGRRNLTVNSMNKALERANLLSKNIIRHSDELARYRALIETSRNRLISHLDHVTVLEDHPIAEHAQSDVAEFFHNLYGYVDAVGNAVGEGPLDFSTTAGSGDVLALIRALERGIRSTS